MSKKKMYLLSVLFFSVALLISMFLVDYNRALKDMPPIFAVRTQLYKDGGTSKYMGFCYQVIDYNQIDGRKDVVFKSIFVSKGN